ncbi:MAG: pyridoxamine 5'-phosphate oxidase family protein [Clostridia bacterium]|nr:pyridoxamine 5'-phosphate oxidase family protein [Clostridia bacterium]
MFREMRRFKQQLTIDECIDVLKNEKRGVLSIIGENGYPYGIPMNHFYDKIKNKIYFHGAKAGYKIDSIKKCKKVCYTVFDKGYRKENDWALNVKSVVVFGDIDIVTDTEKTKEICELLCKKFTDDEEYLKNEIQNHLKNVLCLQITPVHITGKLVNES